MGGCIALVVAAGRGARFGGDTPKQYRDLNGRTIIARSIAAFANHWKVDAVRVVIQPDHRELYDAATADLSILPPVAGGDTRQRSVLNGLESLVDLAPETVLIHDAARPFVDVHLISQTIEALCTAPCSLPVLAVTDTLKHCRDGRVNETVDRTGLWRAQTPQGFHFATILNAHRQFARVSLTDDAAVAERAGLPMTLVAGDEYNIKITTEDDIWRASSQPNHCETRTGFGFDVHQFCPGDHVMLCGINVPHTSAMDGHSDADVALHALTDAVLGAIGAGDIGQHFPPSDAQWKDASSDTFLRHAAALVRTLGGKIVNADLTIVCEKPHVSSYRQAMVESIANILGIDAGRVNVKGTTTERLGFTGRGEGIAAQAVATVVLPTR
jgi:2-C-methyl-D-erythritol 4-phosphate cytidylyltransferase/2-C-methyl-D-erythritol 2,4-cyclodiphosphate synthase